MTKKKNSRTLAFFLLIDSRINTGDGENVMSPVGLVTRFTESVRIRTPIMSAAMAGVSGGNLAAAVARVGGKKESQMIDSASSSSSSGGELSCYKR